MENKKYHIKPTKEVKRLIGLQRACMTVAGAGLVGIILSWTGDSEKYDKLGLISSFAGAGAALGALYPARKRTIIAMNDLTEALKAYEANAQNESNPPNQPNQNMPSIPVIEIYHDLNDDSYLNDPYLDPRR